MKRLRSVLLGTAAVALMSSPVFAADMGMGYGGGGWDGFYAGVGITGASLTNGTTTNTNGYLDVILGMNATSDNLLFGLEGWLGGYSSSGSTTTTGLSGGVEARAGVLVMPEALLYGAVGGVFQNTSSSDSHLTAGVGAEFLATETYSIDIEYKYWAPSGNGYHGHSIGVSALYHF